MRLYILYKTTNLVNQRTYIGCHLTDDLFYGTPAYNDDSIGDTNDLRNDLKLYGRRAFIVEAIHAYPLEDSARNHLEKLVEQQPLGSYNDRPKDKYRAMSLGEKNSFYGKKHTADTLNVLSEHRKGIRWVNDGTTERQIPKDEPTPINYAPGRLKRQPRKPE